MKTPGYVAQKESEIFLTWNCLTGRSRSRRFIRSANIQMRGSRLTKGYPPRHHMDETVLRLHSKNCDSMYNLHMYWIGRRIHNSTALKVLLAPIMTEVKQDSWAWNINTNEADQHQLLATITRSGPDAWSETWRITRAEEKTAIYAVVVFVIACISLKRFARYPQCCIPRRC